MPVIHRELYQVIGEDADNVNTFNIDETHPWMQAVRPPTGQKWAWHPLNNEPVIIEVCKIWDETTEVFIDDPVYLEHVLSDAKTKRIDYLTTRTDSVIQGGMTSNALGSVHNYDTRIVDQLNLDNAERYAELNTNPQVGDPTVNTACVRCNDPSGSLGFIKREHTVMQIKQVRADFHVYREMQSDRLESKINLVNTATTVEAVNAIDW